MTICATSGCDVIVFLIVLSLTCLTQKGHSGSVYSTIMIFASLFPSMYALFLIALICSLLSVFHILSLFAESVAVSSFCGVVGSHNLCSAASIACPCWLWYAVLL